MAYRQVRDILDRVRRLHKHLRDCLGKEEVQSRDKRTRQVLASLRRSEQAMNAALHKYEHADAAAPVLDTWLQYVPDEEVEETLARLEFSSEMRADEAMARKEEFDRALSRLYQQLAEETSVPRVQELFRSLLEFVEQRSAQQSWGVREFQGDEEPPEPDE